MNVDEKILVSYFTGTADAKEKAMVEEWISLTEENKKTAEHLYFLLKTCNSLEVLENIDTDKSFEEFMTIVQKKKHSKRKNRIIDAVQKIAAVLFIPLAVFTSWIFYTVYQNDTGKALPIEVKSMPGIVSKLQLPDGSEVWLNAGSTLKYPVRFSSDNRLVELSGQAYFKVEKDVTAPFIIKVAESYSVEVTGTELNISAYEDDKFIETTLVKGSVTLHIDDVHGKPSVCEMKPMEKSIFSKTNKTVSVKNTNTEYETAWIEGKIIFDDAPMDKVLNILSRYYNVRFDVEDASIFQSHITGKFKNEQLSQILDYFYLSSGIRYSTDTSSKDNYNTLDIKVIKLFK